MSRCSSTIRRFSYAIAALVTAFTLSLSLAPTSQATPRAAGAPSVVALPMPVGPATHPTASQIRQGKVARRVLDARPRNRGKVIDFRRAVKAAGRGNKVIAQDVVLGMLRAGGKVTHLSKKERKRLISRAKRLGQKSVARKLAGARVSMRAGCPGVNSFDVYWWGYRGRLDDCRTERVKDALETVAFTGAFLAVIFPIEPRAKAIMTVAIAIVGLGIFVLDRCSRSKRGVRIYHATTIGPGNIWCLSQ